MMFQEMKIVNIDILDTNMFIYDFNTYDSQKMFLMENLQEQMIWILGFLQMKLN